jgi:hypothetical protein
MKTTTILSALFTTILLGAATGCASNAPPSVAAAPVGAGAGASAEGVVAHAGGAYVLRGDDGGVLYALEAPVDGPARLAPASHERERVAVTGVVVGRTGAAPRLRVASLVVTRGGELDRVIDAISGARCADAPFAKESAYRLDPLHTTGDARFSVHVEAGGESFLVWVERSGDGAQPYAIESVLRARGKVLEPVCAR